MIDIHSHIIPFVDDGSKTMETSIAMIKDEIEQGVTDIIATPHHFYHRYTKTPEELKENFNLLKEECQKQNLNVNLYLGCEILYTSRENVIKMLNDGDLLTMNETKTILLEFSTTHAPDDIDDLVYRFSINDYTVIIAHVERYFAWIDYNTIASLKKMGAKIQINSSAITGDDGFRLKMIAKKLLKLKLVDYIASDVHSFRPSTIQKAYKKVKNKELFNNYSLIQR